MTAPMTNAKPSLRQRLLKPWVVMPAVALVALGGWFALRPADDGAATDTQAVATDQTVAATVGTMAKTVSSEGTVAASQTDDLSFTAAGKVTAVNVKAGDQVKAGQVLATIDSAELEADVADAESTLADAEATLADDTDAGASDEQLEVDEAAVTTAQDGLDAANEALEGASLVASFDGTVASVDLTVGEELASGGTGGVDRTGTDSGSGQSAGTLGSGSTSPIGGGASDGSTTSAQIQVVSSGSFTVELGLDATEVADVEVGQLADVSLSTSSSSTAGGFPGFGGFPGGGFPGAPGGAAAGAATTTTEAADAAPAASTSSADAVQGLVTEVASVADASSGVASYAVTVAFIDTSGTFNVGATASVDITYAEVADAVQVPARAVTSTNGTSTVTVRKDGKDETRTVTTGLSSGTMVQITSGLAEGEEVVITFPGRPNQSGGAGGLPTGGFPGGAVPGGATVVNGAGG